MVDPARRCTRRMAPASHCEVSTPAGCSWPGSVGRTAGGIVRCAAGLARHMRRGGRRIGHAPARSVCRACIPLQDVAICVHAALLSDVAPLAGRHCSAYKMRTSRSQHPAQARECQRSEAAARSAQMRTCLLRAASCVSGGFVRDQGGAGTMRSGGRARWQGLASRCGSAISCGVAVAAEISLQCPRYVYASLPRTPRAPANKRRREGVGASALGRWR